jgi:2-polyprenyl-3-methyl-5-hydroxy-6-metoxy-1,4-benzoquinol methylase
VAKSEEISRAFYAQLGADGLANRTRPEWNEQIVAAVIDMLPPVARVLDVGCGYGRVTLPLSHAGYEVEGIDIAPNLIEAARRAADAEGARINFTVGSMTRLPYAEGSFDAVICLWSAFYELLEEDEQRDAVSEMWRVLRPGGFALIEGPPNADLAEADIEGGARRGPEARIAWITVEGLLNPHYVHDERSLGHICAAAGVPQFDVFERDWAGRMRLFLRLDKPPGSPRT